LRHSVETDSAPFLQLPQFNATLMHSFTLRQQGGLIDERTSHSRFNE
jgi:hypothetical protein